MPIINSLRSRIGQAGPWFALFVILIFSGEALGYVACQYIGTQPPHPAAWLAFAAVALVAGGVGAVLLDWLLLDGHRRLMEDAVTAQGQASTLRSTELALASRAEQLRRLRHDMRGLLSPILLTADRLANHSDPAVQRSGAILVRTVERATVLLTEPVDVAANPPADP